MIQWHKAFIYNTSKYRQNNKCLISMWHNQDLIVYLFVENSAV